MGCGGALVLPNDVIVGDDDGIVVVPPNLIEQVIEYLSAKQFSPCHLASPQTYLVEQVLPQPRDARDL